MGRLLFATSGDSKLIALMMEAASISKTSVNFYQNARRNNPQDSHLENLSTLDLPLKGFLAYRLFSWDSPNYQHDEMYLVLF
jgi:hypothetical protein